jgi:hypothetical protein
MNQHITILRMIVFFMEYPLFSLLKGEIKKVYSKLVTKKIQNLKNLIKEEKDINILIKELDNSQKILNNFILTHHNNLSQEEKFFFKELDICLLHIQDNLRTTKSKIFYELSFSSFLEKLKQDKTLYEILQISKQTTKVLQERVSEATQYGSELNRELDRISTEVPHLLNTIKTLKAQLTLEESRNEILAEEKKALEKELAIEKEKKING